MKSKKSKTKKINIFKPTVNRVYGAAIVVLFLAVFIQSYFVTYLWQAQKQDSAMQTRYLIQNALEGLYQLGKDMTVLDYSANTLTVPSARIVLPLDVENHRGLGAIYSQPSEDGIISGEIQFTESAAMSYGTGGLDISSMEALFNAAPKAQACTRQVVVVINESVEESLDRTDYTEAFEKTLSDGRVVKAYKSTLCTQGADELAAYVEQLNSY